MLRDISIALVAATLLVGCGGGGGEAPSSSASSQISSSMASISSSATSISSLASSSSLVSSSVPASSSSSSVASSSSSNSSAVTLDAAQWVANNTAQLSLTNLGPNVSVITEYDGAKYVLAAPVPVFEGATLELVVEVSSEYKASGAGLQLFAFVDADPWPAKNDCPITASADLIVGSQTISCVLDTGGAFNQTTSPFGLGLQAVAGMSGETKLPVSGTLLITSGHILLADASAGSSSSADMSESSSSAQSSSASSATEFALPASAWYAKDGVVAEEAEGGKNFTFTAGYQAAGTWLNAADAAIEGNIIEVEFMVDANYKTSGAGLKLYLDVQAGDYPSKGDCPVLTNAELTSGIAQTIQCLVNSGGIFNQTAEGVEIKLWAEPGDTAPNGVVQIKGGRIIAAN